ncbi:septum formation initiator family protein [Pelagibacterales bacterium SAG-MED15]|nr:septum formation initiator family protein [Pelagibacterales bacterium SAG-MED15]
MLSKLKKNYFIIITSFLIIYFLINLFGGQRGLFSYFEKKDALKRLKNDEAFKISQINKLELENSLLTDNVDHDFVDILIREKLMLGKKGESTYIIVNNDN